METNPVLKNITDYLIEEVSAEEEELTGAAGGGGDEAGDGRDPTSADVTVETDEKLLKVGGANVTSSDVLFVSVELTALCVCRCWIVSCSTCVSSTRWITTTSVSIPLRTRCLTAVASSTSVDPCPQPGSLQQKVRTNTSTRCGRL